MDVFCAARPPEVEKSVWKLKEPIASQMDRASFVTMLGEVVKNRNGRSTMSVAAVVARYWDDEGFKPELVGTKKLMELPYEPVVFSAEQPTPKMCCEACGKLVSGEMANVYWTDSAGNRLTNGQINNDRGFAVICKGQCSMKIEQRLGYQTNSRALDIFILELAINLGIDLPAIQRRKSQLDSLE